MNTKHKKADYNAKNPPPHITWSHTGGVNICLHLSHTPLFQKCLPLIFTSIFRSLEGFWFWLLLRRALPIPPPPKDCFYWLRISHIFQIAVCLNRKKHSHSKQTLPPAPALSGLQLHQLPSLMHLCKILLLFSFENQRFRPSSINPFF